MQQADLVNDVRNTAMEIDGDDVANAVSSMSTAMPDILGAHGTNLYKVES